MRDYNAEGLRKFAFKILFLCLIISSCSDGGSGNNRRFTIDYSESFSTKIKSPECLVRDRKGNIYTADTDGGIVEMITPDGLSVILARGLKKPSALAVDYSGNVFVCERESGRILCIDTLGEVKVIADKIFSLSGIVIDRDGGIFVSCRKNGKIIKLNKEVPTIFSGSGCLHPDTDKQL